MGRDDKERSRSKKKKKKSSSSRRRARSSSSSSSSSEDYRRRERGKRRSPSSSSDTDSSTDLLLRLEKERLEMKERRRREKERLKALETPEEKRARRLMKKERKNRKEKEEMGWDEDRARYTNEDNPFGDSNLTEHFRWDKKLQAEGLESLDEKEYARFCRQRQVETRLELEKVKKARLEREREREERQAALELEERSRENEKFVKWRKDEDEFHLKQARQRSKIRIQDGRAKPIDLLAKYVCSEEGEFDAIEMHEPYTYLNGLTVGDLEDLLVDIKVYEEIDLNKNKDFWSDITTIVQDELTKLRKMDTKDIYETAAAERRRHGVNKAVTDDVQNVFKGKNSDQLSALKKNIEKKLSGGGGEGVDVGYWETLLGQLKAHLARARLRDRHSENLKNKLKVLKAEQGAEKAEEGDSVEEHASDNEPGPSSHVDIEKDLLEPAIEEYARGNYSPIYQLEEELEPGAIVVSEEEDIERRRVDQEKALKGVRVESALSAEEKALEREARKGMKDDEASFSVESVLEQTYDWSDKYRPRKPRYFNRVHTGFEWNKYNQTHYDVDNPPPKIVQGYKFNIFYPDLIDKSATPSYTLKPCPENRDFCILRVHVGPPYEDIAFKIVNREWEYGYKRGFKCQFHNNIFQLWFHFKRLRYRR